LNAAPLLVRVAKLLRQHKLEAILIGNAAAALQGAPVTTVDIDFLFRNTPAGLKKLRALARSLDAFILRPYYPVSGLYRIARDEDGMQLDFMTVIDGIRSFEGLRKRAKTIRVDDTELTVAALSDIIKSKKAAGRARDLAVLNVLEKALDEESRLPKGKTGSSQEGK
jgi:predicted nucleotidyltransferase